MKRRDFLTGTAAMTGAAFVGRQEASAEKASKPEQIPKVDDALIEKMEAGLLSRVDAASVENISHTASIGELNLPLDVSDLKAAMHGAAFGATLELFKEGAEKTRSAISPRLRLKESDLGNASPEKDTLRLTRGFHTYDNGASIDNVGIMHTAEDFQQQKGTIYDAIRRADIVLLERGAGYFDELRKFVRQQGKEAIYVDYPPLTLLAITIANLTLFIKLIGDEENRSAGRAIARKLLAIPVGLASLPVVLVDIALNSLGVPPQFLMSLVADGRTILFKTRGDAIANANPGKRIAMISGDGHARGIEAYSEPGNRRLFEFKRLYYSIVAAPIMQLPTRTARK